MFVNHVMPHVALVMVTTILIVRHVILLTSSSQSVHCVYPLVLMDTIKIAMIHLIQFAHNVNNPVQHVIIVPSFV